MSRSNRLPQTSKPQASSIEENCLNSPSFHSAIFRIFRLTRHCYLNPCITFSLEETDHGSALLPLFERRRDLDRSAVAPGRQPDRSDGTSDEGRALAGDGAVG